jgi:hypothetical protein
MDLVEEEGSCFESSREKVDLGLENWKMENAKGTSK